MLGSAVVKKSIGGSSLTARTGFLYGPDRLWLHGGGPGPESLIKVLG